MQSEIHHKTISFSEDDLTGNFFGTIRYLPFSRGLNTILKKYVKSQDSEISHILQNIQSDDFEMSFWKRSELGWGEMDGYIEVEDVGLGIEVKYNSGLSGASQLEREAQMLLEWCKTEKRILLLVAGEQAAKTIYQANCHKKLFHKVHLGYITWQDILLGLEDIAVLTKCEETIIKDLKTFLTEKGFLSFHGFTDIGKSIDREQYYVFR